MFEMQKIQTKSKKILRNHKKKISIKLTFSSNIFFEKAKKLFLLFIFDYEKQKAWILNLEKIQNNKYLNNLRKLKKKLNIIA